MTQPLTRTVLVTIKCQCGADAFHELLEQRTRGTLEASSPALRKVYLCKLHFRSLVDGLAWPPVEAAP